MFFVSPTAVGYPIALSVTRMADPQPVEESDLGDRREEPGEDAVKESMSVEEISIFLHRNGIPHRFCEVFEGKMSNLCVHWVTK